MNRRQWRWWAPLAIALVMVLVLSYVLGTVVAAPSGPTQPGPGVYATATASG